MSPLPPAFAPKLATVVREGYGLDAFRHDAIAGLTVAVVALPLAMALAIASGAAPGQGLVTGVVAGFLISALGGSRYQIGGPTGAFVVVVFNVVHQHGYEGLVLATLMAGAMLVIAGFSRLGSWIKYIPLPVITGFTSGIAVIIATSQLGELLGFTGISLPPDFPGKIAAIAGHTGEVNPFALAVGAASLVLMLALRRWMPRWPNYLTAIIIAAIAVAVLSLPVETIGGRYGEIPRTLPVPSLPDISFARLRELLPSAFTIAFLAGVESLLSAVVADGMTGGRHRSNTELIGQGIANCASALFGGLPATGAIARTAINVRAGARSPVSGMMHALFLLLFMFVLAPLVRYVPLASSAAVLLIVAWNMSEFERFRNLMTAPPGDRVVLLLTFALTVLVDLTVAIEVGVVLAAILFMHRMANAVQLQSHQTLISLDQDANGSAEGEGMQAGALPRGVEYLELQGPFFFGVANVFADVMDRIEAAPRACVLVLRQVPLIDATGVGALRAFADHCSRRGAVLILAELQPAAAATLRTMGVLDLQGVRVARTVAEALEAARGVGSPPG